MTLILPHSPFPFIRASEGARRTGVGKSRLKDSANLALSSSGGMAMSETAERRDDDDAPVEVEIDQMFNRATSSISKGRVLPSGAAELLVKVTPLGLGFMPSKILVSSHFDCRCSIVFLRPTLNCGFELLCSRRKLQFFYARALRFTGAECAVRRCIRVRWHATGRRHHRCGLVSA
jgi:hypothetical protein